MVTSKSESDSVTSWLAYGIPVRIIGEIFEWHVILQC